MSFSTTEWLTVLSSFALATSITPLVRWGALRWGAVARPKADRWHRRPTAQLGGVAIFVTAAVIGAIYGPRTPQVLAVMAGGTLLFLVGLIDDFLHIKPYQKLIGQVMAASLVIWSGLALPWTNVPPLDMAITLFWLVGITNAVNLLDNMDGLAAGIAAIAAMFLSVSFAANGQHVEALMLAAFAVALLGFLVYNSHPASIFMGDCGSMFVGFFLAGSALLNVAGGRSRSLLSILAVPLLIMLIPIFDTTLVTILRKLAGRAASQGGRDHTSHRLVALGISERRAVVMLYGLAALSGLLALLVRDLPVDVGLASLAAFTVVLTLLGCYLGGVAVYDPAQLQAARKKPLVAILIDISHKRRIFEVLLDVVLVLLSFYSAYRLLCGAPSTGGSWPGFMRIAAVLVVVKLATFLALSMYRGVWRYVDVEDLVVYLKAVLCSSVGSAVVVLFLLRIPDVPHAVFVLDAVLLLVMLGGSRTTFRVLRRLLPATPGCNRRRVLIYGAGDAGDLLLRELSNNHTLQRDPIGFVDDDRLKQGKRIHGLQVLGGNGMLPGLIRQHRVDEVIISSRKLTEERTREIAHDCATAQVALRRMHIQLEQLAERTE